MFVREQHVLGLSKAEFIEDLRNFSFAIDKMSFVKTDEKWMGCAFPGTKEIQFNFDYWQNQMNTLPREKYCEEFFETVSHECLHGMQTRTDGYNRAGGYNNEIGNRSHAIYEIGTQGIDAKMSRSQTLKDLKENRVLDINNPNHIII